MASSDHKFLWKNSYCKWSKSGEQILVFEQTPTDKGAKTSPPLDMYLFPWSDGHAVYRITYGSSYGIKVKQDGWHREIDFLSQSQPVNYPEGSASIWLVPMIYSYIAYLVCIICAHLRIKLAWVSLPNQSLLGTMQTAPCPCSTLLIPHMAGEDSDQMAMMCQLIWDFTGSPYSKDLFMNF